MAELGETVRPWSSVLKRFWWLPVLAAVATGTLTYATTGVTVHSTYAVINTRSVSDLPNDRLDLITDLGAVTRLDTVLEKPAGIAGVPVSTLRSEVSVTRVSGSTLAAVTFTTPNDDEKLRQDVITSLVEAAATFLSSPGDDTAYTGVVQQAVTARDDAAEAVRQAVVDNGGIAPDQELTALQRRLVALDLANRPATATAALRRQVTTLLPKAQDYAQLVSDSQRASDRVNTLQDALTQQAATRAASLSSLPLTFEGEAPVPTAQTPKFRRVAAASVAGGVVMTGLLIVVGARRRRRHVA